MHGQRRGVGEQVGGAIILSLVLVWGLVTALGLRLIEAILEIRLLAVLQGDFFVGPLRRSVRVEEACRVFRNVGRTHAACRRGAPQADALRCMGPATLQAHVERHWPVLSGHVQRVRGALPTGLLAEGQGDCEDGPAGQFLPQDGLHGTDEVIAGTEGHQQAEPHWHLD